MPTETKTLSDAIADQVVGQDRTTIEFELKEKKLPAIKMSISSSTPLGALLAYQRTLKEWDVIKSDIDVPAAVAAPVVAKEAKPKGDATTSRQNKQALMSQLNEEALRMCRWARLILPDCQAVEPYQVTSIFSDKAIAEMNEKELPAFIERVMVTIKGQRDRPEVAAFLSFMELCHFASDAARLETNKNSLTEAQWAAMEQNPGLIEEAKQFYAAKKSVLEAASAVAA